MSAIFSINSVFKPSEDVVARNIEGEIIIVPLVAGIGDMEDTLFTLNESGRTIWNLMDGKRSLKDIATELEALYEAPNCEIEQDVIGLVGELVSRRMLVETPLT